MTGNILGTITTIRIENGKPNLHISLSFLVDGSFEHGFISGEGFLWFAKILHAFSINNLEEIIREEIIIEQDSKDTPMTVKSKFTGETLGIIDPVSKDCINALNSEYENYKLDTKEKK